MAGDDNKFGFPEERRFPPWPVWVVWAVVFAGALAELIVRVSGTELEGSAASSAW